MKNKIQEQVLKEAKPDRLLFGGGQCFIVQTSLNGKELKLEVTDGEQVLIYSKKDFKKAISRTIELMEEEDNLFIQHIQNHLDKGDIGLKLYKLPRGKVGCAICGETVEEILRK